LFIWLFSALSFMGTLKYWTSWSKQYSA
jgi:hypothetical protein